ncbi:hypothetical protein J7E66_14380 [Bacillus sp. ISL-7]|nr:hypothetical protein [Bacillus sp. ISL-7]
MGAVLNIYGVVVGSVGLVGTLGPFGTPGLAGLFGTPGLAGPFGTPGLAGSFGTAGLVGSTGGGVTITPASTRFDGADSLPAISTAVT